MAKTQTNLSLGGLPRRLVQDGIVDEEVILQAVASAQKSKKSIVTILIEEGLASSLAVAIAASQEFGLSLFDLDALEIDSLPPTLVDGDLIEAHHALPLLKRGPRLFVAISDPTNLMALDEIKFHTGISTDPILVEEDKLQKKIQQFLSSQHAASMDTILDADLDNLEIASEEDDNNDQDPGSEADDTPVVRFVNKVMLDAINKSASDIHVEPYENTFRIRYRIDGVLQEMSKPPQAMSHRIISRIKVMSRMDISERRVPQDGRIKMKLSKNRAIDFRVNTCPTLFGEKIVMRILDPSSTKLGIESLGFEKEQQETYQKALLQPYGMILVTGPTGSGKTVSLYTGLNMLNTIDRNISTAEDPAEINLPGINQVNVNTRVGLTFAEALRAFLRQDPDIIMVGEIRDIETANIAIKAAQTGHLVLSTLHTNDAPQTLSRLANMGVAPFNIATSVSLIISQRLARKLCTKCKTPEEIPRKTLIDEGFDEKEARTIKVYNATGCDHCNNGCKGRVGIYQVMPVTEEMGRIIMAGGNSIEIADQAKKEGVMDLRRAALNKVKAGHISLEEANRVTKE
ncbi:MAG: type IV-A pilus assembly ATPase PilB [Gammaproteobacteria bacterium]|nr:type IV-A pilus assembly ATPase PilB [Gammaproteobacteria bacterium]